MNLYNINNGYYGYTFFNKINKVNCEKIAFKKLFKEGYLETLKMLENLIDYGYKTNDKKFLISQNKLLKLLMSSAYNKRNNLCVYFIENFTSKESMNSLAKYCLNIGNVFLLNYICNKYQYILSHKTIDYIVENSVELTGYDFYYSFNIDAIVYSKNLLRSVYNDDHILFKYNIELYPINLDDLEQICENCMDYGSVKILNYLYEKNILTNDIVKDYIKVISDKFLKNKKYTKDIIKTFKFIEEKKLLSFRKLIEFYKRFNTFNDDKLFFSEKTMRFLLENEKFKWIKKINNNNLNYVILY